MTSKLESYSKQNLRPTRSSTHTQQRSDLADRHFQVLAAGPLEDLLVYHGPGFLEEIDTLSRRSPSFRALLNGVWTSRIDQGVVARLAKYRSAQW